MQVDKLSVKILNLEACAVNGGAATKLMFLIMTKFRQRGYNFLACLFYALVK